MIKHILINGERIKVRGSKYFHYHGKRLLIQNYLEKNSNNNRPLNNDTPDINDTNVQNEGETTEVINRGIPPVVTLEGNHIPNKELNNGISFHSLNVTFDTKTGGFTLEHTAEELENSVKTMPARELAGETDTSAVNTEVKAGGGQQFQTEHVTEKLDIDRKEDVMDKFFTRDMGENLLLVGMLTAGFMLKGRLGEKGEFRERAESW